ncbi:MAG TPA: hypothetical protein VLB50_10200 [Ignavibacteriaceae bacterium]|nr:hypothetical protein [Ignavibacteriaceae bacterium]
MFKKKYLIVLFLLSTFSILYAQPYYYTSTYEPIPGLARYNGDLYRINMNNTAVVETLMTNVFELTSPYSNENGNWLAYEQNSRLFIINPNDISQKSLIADYCDDLRKFSYAGAIDKLIVLYDGKMVLVDPAILTITDTIPKEIYDDVVLVDKNFNFSQNGNEMYMIEGDSVLLKPKIASYSLLTKQIIATKFIDEISESGADEYYFDFKRNGFGVIESWNRLPVSTSYYRIYFLENDSLSISIQRDESQTWGNTYIASDGKYLLIFKSVVPDSVNISPLTGGIDIYDMANGQLKKSIQLPPDGEVMCFENYPNNVYYAKDIELPDRQVWVLNMDSIFNILDLTTLSPSSVEVNSPPFTLTVNGHGFDSLSTIYFNQIAKTTTFISDSVLTTEISTSDISVIGSYPVWVTDQWGISDTLTFEVTAHPSIISSILPPLALPYYATPIEPNVLTITINGQYFTDSTVAYYNGYSKPTTFLSDSVITINLNSVNFPTAGNYPIWVSNYGSVSDTINLSVVNSLPERLIPTLQCIVYNPDKTYTAYFGYNNSNTVPAGIVGRSDYNYFTPGNRYRGQPNIFLPGNHPNVFSTVFDGTNLFWFLAGTRIVLNNNSTPCH